MTILAQSSHPDGMKPAILCVDDERDNVDALERIFRLKFTVLKATSGDEALRILKDNNVCLIISDQRMPNMTGVEFLAKSIELQPDAIRILLTGYTDLESVIEAINSGQVYRYITKPWDPRELDLTVQRAFERYEMSQELKRKNRELEKALKELQTLDQAKSHFMILINHELKTPLTTLINFLDLLKETTLNEEQLSYFAKLQKSTDRLKEIILDVLEFVSAETGQTKIQKKNFKLSSLLKQVEEVLKPELERKTQTLEQHTLDQELTFDPKHMENILKRLLHNASKFGDKGSVISIHQSMVGNKTHIAIENTGKILDTDVVEKILKPFALDEDIMNHSKGIGMGLSICQALLKLHQSNLEIASSGDKVKVSFKV